MQTSDITAALGSWPILSPLLCVPHTEEDYEHLVAFLDRLVDEVGEDESHPLASLMEIVGVLIERYEDCHVSQLEESGH